MEKIRSVKKTQINQVRNHPDKSGLRFVDYGKSPDIEDYSEREIAEMLLGVYKDTRNLLVDGDYFIDLSKVIASKCILETVSYIKNPTKDDYKTNYHNRIDNIRTFYVKDYFLITDEEVFGMKEHKISRYLYRVGALNAGRNNFVGLYSISNDYKSLLFGSYPKDLYHPIKRYINGLFYNDDYRISSFIFVSNLDIHKGE